MNNSHDYLNYVRQQFDYYKSLGDKAISQLNEDSLIWQYNSESNSIAIIVNHLSGNMKSRWTDFLNSDGEKSWRNRNQEFEHIINTKEQLLRRWEEGWDCLFTALSSITEDNFNTLIYIRNEKHSITEAINRQLAHYAYHIGQIVYIAKMIQNDSWISLSIPRSKSEEYNQKKFSKGKH